MKIKAGTFTPEQMESMQVAAGLGEPKSPVKGKEAEAFYAALLKQCEEIRDEGAMIDIPAF